MCYEYGNMGEVTKETRIYALPFLSQPLALSTLFEYDSWGRILNITYPDNEIVSYDYDLGGQLFRMYDNSSYNYLDNIIYDKFGAKTSQDHGNGIVTQYTYNDTTRRLSEIATNNGALINYTYDLVGNVTQVTSVCPWLQNQSFTETFSYDSTDQLISANETQSYQLAVNYGNWGKVMQYDIAQTDMLSNATETHSRNYSYPAANYSNAQTSFAPIMQTGDEQINLSYGINGSLRKKEVTQPQQNTEYYLFNSQDNLKAYSDDIMDFAYYGYNAANTRTYKLSLYNTNIWINGQQEPLNMQLQQAMFYPNTYLNFNGNGEYTKHYYNGTERIASRLGDNTTTIAINSNVLEDRKLQVENLFKEDIQELISEPTQVDMPPMLDILNLQPIGTPNDIYYYHPNHLGSTSFVTDQNQTITQGFLYAPFGEITTEYNATFGNDIIPKYSFNAKELDEETGMYYYEARYYAPPTFTSRDPLFEKYFWMSPYAYCANNPVKYVDPTGMEGIVVSGGEYDDENRYKYNFIEPAITKLKELKAAGGSEPITWIVATAGYSESDLASFKKIADELGVGFQTISSADEFTNYLNSKDVSTTNLSDARKKDKITSMSIFGHGYVGSVEFAHNQDNQNNFSWGIDKVNQLVASAFNNARVDFYTCNSATDTETRKSLGYVFSKQTGSIVTGFRGQSTYSQMNNGQGFSAKWNRNKNGFNTNGSIALPQTGKDAVRVRYTHQTQKKK